ncbi:MAG: hypothetical protein HYV09_03360 [Deltaproteobacteria bacterium]|nr:hypothetical protein [Deltaproteobacteria bacterium]
MSFCSLNGLRVLRGSLTLPRLGRWHADLVVDTNAPLTGRVTTTFGEGAMSFAGTVYRGDVFQDSFHCRIVGGANGLSKELPAKYYRGVPMRLPLQDLLAECGETLSASADEAVLARLLQKWTRTRGPAAHALAELADLGEASWRFMPNGSLWIGREGWLEVDFPHQLLRSDPTDDRIEIASDLPLLRPGTVFAGRRVSAVVHSFGPDKTRTEAWIERDGLLDRFKGSLVSIIRSVMSEVDYHKPYPARVVVQDSDGTLQLKPDSDRIPGLTGVPIRYGIPGVTARVPPGTRCIVEFENGDSRTPIVTAFEPGALIELSFDGGSRSIARVDDTADCGALSWASDPSGKSLTLSYRRPGTLVAVPFLALAFPAVKATPDAGEIAIESVIRSGAPKLRA